MNAENINLRPVLLPLFDEGKCPEEAYEEIGKMNIPHTYTLKSIRRWFNVFKSEQDAINSKEKRGRKPKFSDQHLIGLINENPNLNTKELSKLTNTSISTISRRLKQISANSEYSISYLKIQNNRSSNLTEEHLINLINENPDFNIKELAIAVGVSTDVILNKLKYINRDGERVKYIKKYTSKFTDELLINLIDQNPQLNMEELARLAGATPETLSNRIKLINNNGERASYIKKGPQNGSTLFTDEFLIDLINKNPDLNMAELAKVAGTTQSTISNRIKQINSKTKANKIVLKWPMYKPKRKLNYTSEKFLIKLVNENPEVNITELSNLAGITQGAISKRLKKINSNGERVNYIQKRLKFTDEFLIKLVNENPELNMKELAKSAGTSTATILNRIKQINSNGLIIDYQKKEFKSGNKKLTDEYLTNLINENPGLKMSELAEITNTTVSNISRRLKKINHGGERAVYIKKYKCNTEKSSHR
jgi:transcriptional antiterminator